MRYIKKEKLTACEVCGKEEEKDNKFQNAHKIGFGLGIIELALTPEFIDGDRNIVTAHRNVCNSGAELDIIASMRFLLSIGIGDLPMFLPSETRSLWAQLKTAV